MNYKHTVGTKGPRRGPKGYQKFRWLTDLRVGIDIEITREFGDKWASNKIYLMIFKITFNTTSYFSYLDSWTASTSSD